VGGEQTFAVAARILLQIGESGHSKPRRPRHLIFLGERLGRSPFRCGGLYLLRRRSTVSPSVTNFWCRAGSSFRWADKIVADVLQICVDGP